MRSFPKLLALFLIGLFLAFSFNAYACVVPVNANIPVTQTQGSDCTMPGEEPVTQFCDGFKTLAVQSSLDTPSSSQPHVPFIGEMAILLPDLVPSRNFIFPPGTGHVAVPKDLLVLISVFRI